MTIYQLLSPKNILLELEVEYKFDAINALVDTFVDVIENELLEEIREAIISREKIMSTGIGQGLAIPHGKTDAITQNYAAFARLKTSSTYIFNGKSLLRSKKSYPIIKQSFNSYEL